MMMYGLAFLALLFLALLALGYQMSSLLLSGRRRTVTRTPQDYDLPFEPVTFQSKEGLSLRGWWIPTPSPDVPSEGGPAPAVILLHPMFGNRQGVCAGERGWLDLGQGSVDLLKVASGFHQAGYAALLFDFRNHGESSVGLCAGGLSEDQDVVGAVDYVFQRLAAQRPEETPQVGLVGFGLGACAAICAVGREKGSTRTIRVFSADQEGSTGFTEFPPPNVKRLSFLVLIQPASLRTLLDGYIRRVFPPLSWLLVLLADRLCRWRGGYPLDGALLHEFAHSLCIPALYVQARSAAWGACGEVQRLYEATPGTKQLWWIEEPPGRLAVCEYVANHLDRVLAFTARYVNAHAVRLDDRISP